MSTYGVIKRTKDGRYFNFKTGKWERYKEEKWSEYTFAIAIEGDPPIRFQIFNGNKKRAKVTDPVIYAG